MNLSLKIDAEKRPPLVMGIINLSPDSFCGKNRSSSEKATLEIAERLVEEGADILDIGAESSRPGSHSISVEDELEKLIPVVTQLSGKINIPVSVDTWKPAVAERVLDLGVKLINDITGLQKHPEMAGVIAGRNAGVILMHMQGTPETMQNNPSYKDLFGEIITSLKKSISIAEQAGIQPDKIAVDPGIGFGKTTDHNLKLLGQLSRFKELDKAILVGVSRKSFIGDVLDLPVEERLEASLAAGLMAMMEGADVLRVHDVKETVRAVKMAHQIKMMGGN